MAIRSYNRKTEHSDQYCYHESLPMKDCLYEQNTWILSNKSESFIELNDRFEVYSGLCPFLLRICLKIQSRQHSPPANSKGVFFIVRLSACFEQKAEMQINNNNEDRDLKHHIILFVVLNIMSYRKCILFRSSKESATFSFLETILFISSKCVNPLLSSIFC